MHTYLEVILFSLGSGALYATLAQGLLLTFRSSGILNFSYGAIAMYGAYVYSSMRTSGAYPLPPVPNPLAMGAAFINLFGAHLAAPSVPPYITFHGPLSVLPALLATVLTGVV